jgi:type II secretory pathway component PulC
VKQNVSGPTAMLVLVLALILAYFLFNRQTPEPVQYTLPVPETPPLEESQVSDMHRGLAPLGIYAVLPPLREDRMKGVRVVFVLRGTPAEKAGLQPGDFITAMGGQKLMSPDTLIAYLTIVEPAKSYALDVVRSGKPIKLTATGITPLPFEQRVR